MSVKRKDDDYSEEDVNPFDNVKMQLILREAKCFSDKELSPYKCMAVIVKLLYLIQQGEHLTNEEATDLFFATTKLFQNQDVQLRRLTYLLLKELTVDSDNSLIVVSCLSKDMTSKVDLFRSNSIRVLAKIMDGSMLGQMERFLKQSLVDKNPTIITAVLCLGEQLYRLPGASDVIKRWLTEVQEQLMNRNPMVAFHALALLLKIKSNDKLAISKIVTSLAKNNTSTNNALQQVLYLRVIYNILQSTNPLNQDLLKYVRDSLKSRHALVKYEATRTMSRLTNITSAELVPAITVLQDMLNSTTPTYRFAAVRTLNDIVIRYPSIITPCIVELEHLINDSNRSIATLAITVLLKTGNEQNIEKLIKNISQFITEINDEFKFVLIDAIKSLTLKFPSKHVILLNFLAAALREEGGYKYKKCIVDTILEIVSVIDTATELALEHFCEFIEDCEFPELSITILHLLGQKGSKTANPAKYIRFIFNRVILETASVRAAAVSSLAQFAFDCPTLTNNIMTLLRRSLLDNDDEVRERAMFYLHVLEHPGEREMFTQALHKQLPPLHSLEYSLIQYGKSTHKTPFNVKKHYVDIGPEVIDVDETEKRERNAAQVEDHHLSLPTGASTAAGGSTAATTTSSGIALSPYIDQLQAIPELAQLGTIFKSTQPSELTEAEAEYVVQCIKHVTDQHIIFQYLVTNNMERTELSNVTVEMECGELEWEEELKIPEATIAAHATGITYVVYNRPPMDSSVAFSSGSIACTLQFTSKDVVDGSAFGAGTADEYQLEEIEVSENDFMKPGEYIGIPEFRSQWEALGNAAEVVKKYSLGLENLQSAVSAVVDLLGVTPIEGCGQVPEGAKSHSINCTGTFYPDTPVYVRAQLMLQQTVTLKIAVRSTNEQINTLLVSAVR